MNKREFIYASVLLIFFFLLWFVPRQPAVMENLLLFDDYYIAYDDPRASV